jgi:leader peptidase (prepilin peptidase)/N-methyltransferase
MIRFDEVPASIFYVYATLLGLFGGSFLNVVIYRAPRGMSVARPPSHCPGCQARVKFYDNIPVLSYLVLRGKARCCGIRISPRYVFVELIGGALGLALAYRVVSGELADGSLLRAGAVFLANLIFALSLVAVAFIDLEHMYIPDPVSIGGTVFGIATSSLRDMSFADAILGAVIGFVAVWLPFSVLYRWIRGRTGMGLGDAKLVMLAGAWFGWQGAVFALLAGAVQGTIAAIVLLLTKGRIDEPSGVQEERAETERALAELSDEERAQALSELARDPLYEATADGVAGARIAFGPFLVLAMLELLLIGQEGIARWIGLGL